MQIYETNISTLQPEARRKLLLLNYDGLNSVTEHCFEFWPQVLFNKASNVLNVYYFQNYISVLF